MGDATTPCRCHDEESPNDEPIDYRSLGFGPDGRPIRPIHPETIRLAAVELPHGTKIELWGSPADGEVGFIEIGDAHTRPTFGREPNLSTLEMYTRLVPKDVPVPELLLKLEDTEAQAALRKQYSFQELIEEPIVISDDQFDLALPAGGARSGTGFDSGYGPWNCNKGTQDFTNFACNGYAPPDVYAVTWCDPSKHYKFLDRRTSCRQKRFKSLGVTAVCNTRIGYVRHFYRNCVSGIWTELAGAAIPDGYWAWTRYTGILKRARWVQHGVLPTPAGAYFRAFTAMYN